MEQTPKKVTILGSGTSTGVPVIACDCEVCQSPEPKNQRSRCSILIETQSGAHIVIDTGPEFRMQMLRESVKELNHVIYTHTHADHCHGFDDLRAFYFRHRKPIHCYLAKEFADEFRCRFAYAFADSGYRGTLPSIQLEEVVEKFSIGSQQVEHIRLEHGNVLTSAFRFGRFAYATDFKRFSDEQIDVWKGKIDTMVASGIRFQEHATHSSVPETIELFKRLGVKKGVITHLSHNIEYLRDSQSLPDGVCFAYDGLTLPL